jgi:hypothetical protein
MPTLLSTRGERQRRRPIAPLEQLPCHCTPAETDADIAGIPALVVSTDPRLLTHAEPHAARYGTHRFLAKPLDLDAMLHAIQEMIGEA